MFHRVFLLVNREPIIEEQRSLSIPQHLPHSVITALRHVVETGGAGVKYFSWLEVNPLYHGVSWKTGVQKRMQAEEHTSV